MTQSVNRSFDFFSLLSLALDDVRVAWRTQNSASAATETMGRCWTNSLKSQTHTISFCGYVPFVYSNFFCPFLCIEILTQLVWVLRSFIYLVTTITRKGAEISPFKAGCQCGFPRVKSQHLHEDWKFTVVEEFGSYSHLVWLTSCLKTYLNFSGMPSDGAFWFTTAPTSF